MVEEKLVKGFCISGTGKGLEALLCWEKVLQRQASEAQQRSSRSSSLPLFQGKAVKWLILEFTN